LALEATSRRDPNKLVLATNGHFDAYGKAFDAASGAARDWFQQDLSPWRWPQPPSNAKPSAQRVAATTMVIVAPPFVAHGLAEHPTRYPASAGRAQPHREHSGHRQAGFGPCRQVDACNPALMP
jgi:hypothetical protein